MVSNPYQNHLVTELNRARPTSADETADAALDQRILQLIGELTARAEHEARLKYDPAFMSRNVPI